MKCHQYWPDLYETMDYGHLQVTCLKEEQSASFAFREFTLVNIEVRATWFSQLRKRLFTVVFFLFFFQNENSQTTFIYTDVPCVFAGRAGGATYTADAVPGVAGPRGSGRLLRLPRFRHAGPTEPDRHGRAYRRALQVRY